MRLIGIALTLALSGATAAHAAEEKRFADDATQLAYCSGFWRGLVKVVDYGLEPKTLGRSLEDEIERTRAALLPIVKPEAADKTRRLVSIAFVQSGYDQVHLALRDSKRTIGMSMQETAEKLVAYQAPLCDQAIAGLEQEND